VPAEEVRDLGYPGFAGLGLGQARAAWSEPYIYHFPDGNASLARLLVRSLIPGVAPGNTMDDVVQAPFDYSRLDGGAQNVRLRLDATCLDVRNAGDEVRIGYSRSGAMYRVAGRHAVLACFHSVIPHIMPELPAPQREALSRNVKTPIVYTNVIVRNWRAFTNLRVSGIAAPMSFHHQVSLDFPVSLGGYRHTRDPDQPVCLHLVHVPGAPHQGLDARAQFRIGQGKLLAMTFADFEARIRDDLDRMLGPGGFVSARDIAAITVNRWPHGYSYVANSLYDPEDYDDTVLKLARHTAGRITIANTDSGGDAWVHFAIDQAARAVGELAE
jgi:spermidine dehydrogenase